MTEINKVYSQVISNMEFDIYLSGDIDSPENYIQEFQVLREAKPDDVVRIHINSPGGWIQTAAQWVAAIRNCDATVIGLLEGFCHSAATFVLLACDGWEVNKHSFMLVHNYTGGGYGKGDDLVASVLSQHEWVKRMMEDIYKGFLTPEELAAVTDNKDYYFHYEEILERLGRVNDFRVEAAKAAEQEALESAREQLKNLEDDTEDLNI